MSYHLDAAKAERTQTADSTLFLRRIGELKTVSTSTAVINGVNLKILTDTRDSQAPLKKFAVQQAVTMVTNRGFKMPADSSFLLTPEVHHQNQAFHFDIQGTPVCWVSLGPTSTSGGSGRGISAEPGTRFDCATRVTLHELGHMFHAHNVGRTRFYTDDRMKAKNPGIGVQVSGYAHQNICKEIIAESFLGMMIGRNYGQDVLQYYQVNGGPRVLAGAGTAGFGIL